MPACEKCGWDPAAVQFRPYDNAMSVYVNTVTGATAVIKSEEAEIMIGAEGKKILHVLKTKYAEWKQKHPLVAEGVPPIIPPVPIVPQPVTTSFGPQPTTTEESVTIMNPMGVMEQKPLSALPRVQYAEPAPSAPMTPKPSPFDVFTPKA